MQVIKVGDVQFVVAKTNESLFILGMEEGNFDKPWSIIGLYGSFCHHDMAISVNHNVRLSWQDTGYLYDNWLMVYGSSREFCDYLGTGNGLSQYKQGNSFHDLYTSSRYNATFNAAKDGMVKCTDADKAPDRYKAKKNLIDILTPLLSHFPYQYRDVPGVRIVLNNENRNLPPEDIIAHAISTNISLLTIGIIRVSWSNDDEGLTGTYKYKFRTHRECFDEFVKTVRRISKPIEDAGCILSNQCSIVHINDDPKDNGLPSSKRDMGYISVDDVIKDIDTSVSTTTNAIRKMFTDITSSTVTNYKTIYVTGWEIVAAYQSLKCSSCMIGRLEEYDNYMVEAYALSKNASLALFIHTDQEGAVRQHLSDIASKCERGVGIDEYSEWYHSGIVARSMVWKFENHEGQWHDRLYWNSDLPGRKANTICSLFLSAMKADGINQYRAHPNGIYLVQAELILTPSSGDWDDDQVGIPFMDTFDYGFYDRSKGTVRCFTSMSHAEIAGVKRKHLFELKNSRGLQYVKECLCPECEEVADNLSSIHVYDRGYIDIGDCCADQYVLLDRRTYGRETYAHEDNCFYCESTESHFINGDDVPNHVNIDDVWYHEDSEEVIALRAKEDNEPEMVSAIYDPSDLRRRAQYPITDCRLDAVRDIYVLSSIWNRYQERRNEEAALVMHAMPEPQLPNSRELIDRLAQLGAVRMGQESYYWSIPSTVADTGLWSAALEIIPQAQETV